MSCVEVNFLNLCCCCCCIFFVSVSAISISIIRGKMRKRGVFNIRNKTKVFHSHYVMLPLRKCMLMHEARLNLKYVPHPTAVVVTANASKWASYIAIFSIALNPSFFQEIEIEANFCVTMKNLVCLYLKLSLLAQADCAIDSGIDYK